MTAQMLLNFLLNGGVENWKIMSPRGGGKPAGTLLSMLEKSFGSFDAFKDRFSEAAANIFGSGWAWLSVDSSKRLVISATKL